jgi:GTP cyclohydrolase I
MDPVRHKAHCDALKALLADLGEDPASPRLAKTPARVVESLGYLLAGNSEDPQRELTSAVYDAPDQDMVVVRDIEVYSLCEHHMLPFFGLCHVGYIPRKKVTGLSKIPRMVEGYSRRLQMQERLTRQVAEAVKATLDPLGVGVIIEASHLCMQMRGAGRQGSFTVTSAMLGSFSEPGTKSEFLSHVRDARGPARG